MPRINVKQKQLLNKSAIIIEAGEGKQDRLMTGSYLELRQKEEAKRETESRNTMNSDLLGPPDTNSRDNNDPFGIGLGKEQDAKSDDDPFGLGTDAADREEGDGRC